MTYGIAKIGQIKRYYRYIMVRRYVNIALASGLTEILLESFLARWLY